MKGSASKIQLAGFDDLFQTGGKAEANGEQAASAVIYTRQEADAITFEAGGSVLMDVEKYDLAFDGQETEGQRMEVQ